MGTKTTSGASTGEPPRRRRRGLKIAAVCVLQLAAIILLAESIVRVGGLDRPLAGAISFGGSDDPLHQTDRLLFYALRPQLDTTWQGAPLSTNSLGLRGPEVPDKAPGEYRILSLGESSTFGARVADDQTYSANLQQRLREHDPQRTYRVINAGVCGYTSFQSLTYLRHRGLQLQPDLVLFYHEINDALPVEVSDPQRFAAQGEAWHRRLAEWSATYRALSTYVMQHKRERQRTRADPRTAPAGPVDESSLEPMDLPGGPAARVPRVSPAQRREIFAQLAQLCRSRGITLVFIHPTYAESAPHTCELTEYCQSSGVPLFEAYDCLHPAGAEPHAFFADECHPNAEGHQRLAAALCEFLTPIIVP